MKLPSLVKPSAPVHIPKIPARKKTPLRTRPAGQPIAIPRIILSQLNGLSAKVLQISMTEGIIWIVGVVAAIVLVQCGLDWLFDLAWNVRLLFIIADLALLGWVGYRYLFRPMQKKLTPEQAALRAEMKWPALRTSLISAVQLARSPEGSTRMVEILVQQVAKRAAQMDFRHAVDAKHLRKPAIITLIVTAVTVGLGMAFPKQSPVLLSRLLLSHEPLPTSTMVEPISTDFKIPAGESIELKAKVKEGSTYVPPSGTVEINYKGKGSQTVTVTPDPQDPTKRTFTLKLPNVQQDLTYRFRLNDGRGEEYSVVIQRGPVLQKTSFEENFPAYTGLAKTPLSAGNLKLLAGSKLHIEGNADQDLRAAHIVLKGPSTEIPATVSGNKISADVPIPAQGLEGFSISMENTDGIASANNTLYRVEVTPDKPPEITFAPNQSEDKTFISDDQPVLHFKVVDDFQVKRVYLCVQNIAEAVAGSDEGPGAEQAPTAEKVTRIQIDVPTPAAALNFDYIWKDNVASGLWKEGKTVSYWIEAEDNNDVTGPGIGKSGKRQWRIITVAEMQKELKDKEKDLAGKLDEVAGKQHDLQQGVGKQINQTAAPNQ